MHTVIDQKEFKRRFLVIPEEYEIIANIPVFISAGKNPDLSFMEENDTFVTQNEDGECLKRYRFANGKLVIEKDFIKSSKPADKKDFDKGAKLSNEDVIKWNIKYRTDHLRDNKTTTAEYQVYTEEFRKRFKFFHSIDGFRTTDRYEYTCYASPHIMCDQNKPLEDHIKEYEELIKYFDYSDHGEDIGNAIRISILEYTCSEFGCYSSYVREDGTCALFKTAWHHTSKLKDFKDYKEMIEYIRENHPYELTVRK